MNKPLKPDYDLIIVGASFAGLVAARDYPRFGVKTWMRRAWSAAPANTVINATLFTPPMRALAEWIYFQGRAGAGINAGSGEMLRRAPNRLT